jgi:hypothetical protein
MRDMKAYKGVEVKLQSLSSVVDGGEGSMSFPGVCDTPSPRLGLESHGTH